MTGWVHLVGVVGVAIAPLPPATARTAQELNALATLSYRSAQTETVAARVSDARLVAMRARIETSDKTLAQTRSQLNTLRAAARGDKIKLAALERLAGAQIAEVSRLKIEFTTELARRDEQYARDIAILRAAGEQLLATPDGARALSLYNEGGVGAFEAADAVLAQVEKARDQARQDAARKQLADDRRARATLALDARDKGLTTTAVAIERWKAVVEADPRTAFDWIDLTDLYIVAGRLDEAANAASAAGRYSTNERDRAVSLNKTGEIAVLRGNASKALVAFSESLGIARKLAIPGPSAVSAQRDLSLALNRVGDALTSRNDLTGALTAYQESLSIARTLAAGNPTSTLAQRDMFVVLTRVGAVHALHGDLTLALSANEEGLTIARKLAAVDLKSAQAQRDLSVILEKVGDIRFAKRNLPGALTAYEEALAIARKLLALDPGLAQAQRGLSVELNKIGDVRMASADPAGAAVVYGEALEIRRRLAEASPSSSEAQRDVPVSLVRMGDTRVALNDLTGALVVYREGLDRFRKLADRDPSSAAAQRDVFVVLFKLAQIKGSGIMWNEVAKHLEAMKARNQLLPIDEPSLTRARERAAREAAE